MNHDCDPPGFGAGTPWTPPTTWRCPECRTAWRLVSSRNEHGLPDDRYERDWRLRSADGVLMIAAGAILGLLTIWMVAANGWALAQLLWIPTFVLLVYPAWVGRQGS